MPSEHAEVERKYESVDGRPVDVDAALDAIPSMTVVGAPVTTALDATYFDTADLALLERRIVVRRRTGGDDAGWHLKLPRSGDERREVRAPLGRATRTPPRALRGELRAYLRGRPLVPVARIRTERTERHLHADDGTERAVVADDRVRSERLLDDDPTSTRWIEVEVELVDGRLRDLDAVERALKREAGMRRSRWPSKLARALGYAGPDADDTSSRVRIGTRTSAAVVVLAHLDEQVAELLSREADVRRDAPDAVHKMRVATRRLRSALKTFGPLFDNVHIEPTRTELKWLGEQLGRPRDAEVQRDGLLELLADQPAAHVVGPVRRRIKAEMKARHDAAHAELVAALESERYEQLLERLDRLVGAPGFGPRAGEPARDGVRTLTAKAAQHFDRAARRAKSVTSPEELDVALHEVRKAAKRARYAAEVATAVGGTRAARIARRMEDVQEVLGVHQDTVTTRELLRELADVADANGESSYTYGVLHGAEHERGRLARARYGDVRRAAQKNKVRAWLS